jgi:cell division protein FtsL
MNKSKIKILNIVDIKKLNIVAIVVVIAAIFLYLYSYQLSVSYAASVQNLEDKISNIKSEISEVEFQIVESKRAIDKQTAVSRGFVELEEVVFVKKTSQTALNAVTN